ncbi:MAG: chromosome segregation protein SMC [Sphingobacteriia bacterium]|nr:chromosome segregation protein SMC [Sphingobacteriia bacterium]NCC38138.1 chromosome segregation protein SMC [Gammaproteobacteria bacterium]
MRLEKIRLAGFKSFVDPTTVNLPSNLVGVVGPNGCGKSNVIDAVRWVMGESSAKLLRGESMADVIFNGSTSRQPVGTASIELVFDNSDGGAGGAYSGFNQISVRRQVSRDGQSIYALNGTRCRRRDIQDLFLGTGLGPRSYAIIEQGMISRVIEARPEDLRLFLEEAAGISKYKERRRETESRMRETRANLARLDDLREEVGKQLQHLERQAAAAERYRQLKAEERRLDLETKALRWRELDTSIQEQERRLAETQHQSALMSVRQSELEAEIATTRDQYQEAAESFNAIQGRFYAVGSAIAQAEQAIQFASEERGRREGELVRMDQEIAEVEDHLARDQDRLAEIAAVLERDEPALVSADQQLAGMLAELAQAEARLGEWERQWDELSRVAAAPAAEAQAQRARINALEQGRARDEERQRRLQHEIAQLEALDLDARIGPLTARARWLTQAVAELAAQRETARACIADLDQRLEASAEARDRIHTDLQEARGRLSSLAALQEAALTDIPGADAAWRERLERADAQRLIERIAVAPGWERALEVLLGETVSAWLVRSLEEVTVGIHELPPGLVLLEAHQASSAGGASASPRAGNALQDPIQACLSDCAALATLVGRVRAVPDLDTALAERARLAPDERLVTPAGIRVGAGWLMVPRPDAHDGVIARAEAIRATTTAIADLQAVAAGLSAEQEHQRAARQAARARLAEDEQRHTACVHELATVEAELAGLRTRAEHRQERLAALSAEREDLLGDLEAVLEQLEEGRESLHERLAEVADLAEQRDALAVRREQLREALAEQRKEERRARERMQGLKVSVESNRAARAATQHSLARIQARRVLLREHRDALLDELEASVEPLAEQRARLDEQLARRVEIEQSLAGARGQLERLDGAVRALEQTRHRVEQESQTSQRELDRQRLEWQECRVRRQTFAEQIAEAGRAPGEVLAGLEAGADLARCQAALAQTAARLQRLGAVNLAAVDEYRQQADRKVYLDTQHDDISRSLETLEQAIRKIDRETRGRFRETHERVNQSFQQLFPRLFGGGHASLELTDEDLLETGIRVMARPPGKRNSSIHLLSGGEKALTAVALVFAIFQLNPAPFCLLDEVDAPLDDANVGRFCELVRSMSERVQFVFISHNKVTMEMAHHLLGVTMHEPGVSRLVSVDMDEATRLAAQV